MCKSRPRADAKPKRAASSANCWSWRKSRSLQRYRRAAGAGFAWARGSFTSEWRIRSAPRPKRIPHFRWPTSIECLRDSSSTEFPALGTVSWKARGVSTRAIRGEIDWSSPNPPDSVRANEKSGFIHGRIHRDVEESDHHFFPALLPVADFRGRIGIPWVVGEIVK